MRNYISKYHQYCNLISIVAITAAINITYKQYYNITLLYYSCVLNDSIFIIKTALIHEYFDLTLSKISPEYTNSPFPKMLMP